LHEDFQKVVNRNLLLGSPWAESSSVNAADVNFNFEFERSVFKGSAIVSFGVKELNGNGTALISSEKSLTFYHE
jgi:hypothetical protein